MQEVLDRMRICKGKVVLEIGVGNCPYFLKIPGWNEVKICESGAIGPDDYYIGIDTPDTITERTWNTVSAEEQKRIRRDFKELKFGYAEKAIAEFVARGFLRGQYEFLEANGLALPFADETVDKVIMRNVVGAPPSHFVNKDKRSLILIFLEAIRVLKEQGRIIVIEDDTPEAAYEWLGLLDYHRGRRVQAERNRQKDLRVRGSRSDWDFRIDFKKSLWERADTTLFLRKCLSDNTLLDTRLSESSVLVWGRTWQDT